MVHTAGFQFPDQLLLDDFLYNLIISWVPALELGQASHAQDLTTFRSANGQVVGAEGTLLGGPIPSSKQQASA